MDMENKQEKQVVAEKKAPAFTPYSVRVNVPLLNVRIGAGTDHAVKGTVKQDSVYEIVEETAGQGSSTGWGRMKQGGWVSLDHCVKAVSDD